MAIRSLQSNYFADDKDIYDLLISARQKLSVQRLVEMARRRGLLLSAADDRAALVDQVALLPFGWHELQHLIELTDTAERLEKVSSRSLFGKFTLEDVKEAAEVLREDRSNRGESYRVEQTQRGVRVSVTYSELDPTKTRLVQRTRREFTLEFETPSDGEILVRHQDQDRAEEVLTDLVALVSSKPDLDLLERKIELAGVASARLRTEFFLIMIGGIEGYILEDVKAVKASRARVELGSTIAPPDEVDELEGDEESHADDGEIVGEPRKAWKAERGRVAA